MLLLLLLLLLQNAALALVLNLALDHLVLLRRFFLHLRYTFSRRITSHTRGVVLLRGLRKLIPLLGNRRSGVTRF